MQRTTFIIFFLFMLPATVYAQGERFGAIAGTWEACMQSLQPLQDKYEALKLRSEIPRKLVEFAHRRLVNELDQCAKLSDAPMAARIDLIGHYEVLKLEDRALQLALDAAKEYGATTDLNLISGRLFYKRGNVTQGLPLLEKVVEDRPTDIVAHEILGAHYYGQGELKRSIQHLRVVAEGKKNEFGPNASLGDACLEAKDFKCAGEFLGRASIIKPEDGLLAIKVGDLQRLLGVFDEAIVAYERARKLKGMEYQAEMGLGYTELAMNNTENAESHFARASFLAPNNVLPFIEVSRVRRQNGRPYASDLRSFAMQKGSILEAHLEYLLALLIGHQKKVARNHLKRVPLSFMNNPRVMAIVGDVYLANQKPKKALGQYRMVNRIEKDIPVYLVREARALRELKQYQEAINFLDPYNQNKSKQDPILKTEYVMANFDESARLAAAKKFVEATDVIDKAKKRVTDNEVLNIIHAALLAEQGDLKQALRLQKNLIDSPHAKALAAWLAFKEKKLDPTHRLAKEAFQQEPTAGTLVLQGASLIKQGRNSDALKLFEQHYKAYNMNTYVQDWHAQAFTNIVNDKVQAGNIQNAPDTINLSKISPYPQKYQNWLLRVLMTAYVKAGQLKIKSKAYKLYRGYLGKPSEQQEIDKVLFAIAEIQSGSVKQALKTLRNQKSKTASIVRSRGFVELISDRIKRRRTTEAKKYATQIEQEKLLSFEAQHNIALAKNIQSAERLVPILKSYISKHIPAASFNYALVLDATSNNGAKSMGALSEAIKTTKNKAIKQRAEILLSLKRRLYQ